MNQKFKIVSVVFLISIYINALGISLKSEYYDDYINVNNTLDLKYLEDLNVKLIANISHSFIDFKDLKNERLSINDNQLNNFKLLLKNYVHLIIPSISLYISDSKNILVKYRKQNYIFPFHYFW